MWLISIYYKSINFHLNYLLCGAKYFSCRKDVLRAIFNVVVVHLFNVNQCSSYLCKRYRQWNVQCCSKCSHVHPIIQSKTIFSTCSLYSSYKDSAFLVSLFRFVYFTAFSFYYYFPTLCQCCTLQTNLQQYRRTQIHEIRCI